jgi:2-phospho-L-lactate guanylyltransferase
MATLVVPFRSTDPKRRLDGLGLADRSTLAHAMLADVLDAAVPVGEVLVVAPDALRLPAGAEQVADPRRGQGAAVRAALDAAAGRGLPAPFLVVNADLPCVTARDLLELAGAVPDHGLALVAAADGTTNALALSSPDLFAPLYGPGSAARFAAVAPSRLLHVPNLVADVDTDDDLERVRDRLGWNTRRALARLQAGAAA